MEWNWDKDVMEESHGRSEPHTSLSRAIPNPGWHSSPKETVVLPVLPSVEPWFPHLSIFPLKSDTSNPSWIYPACLICITTFTISNKLVKKKILSSQSTFSFCFWMWLLAQLVLLLVIHFQTDAKRCHTHPVRNVAQKCL